MREGLNVIYRRHVDGHRAVTVACLQACTESVLAPQSVPLVHRTNIR
jgi:hypothetical protein